MREYQRFVVFNVLLGGRGYRQRSFDSIGAARTYARECQRLCRVNGWPLGGRFVVRHRGQIIFDAAEISAE